MQSDSPLPHLASLYARALETASFASVKISWLRDQLAEQPYDWTCTDNEWKRWKKDVREEWQRLGEQDSDCGEQDGEAEPQPDEPKSDQAEERKKKLKKQKKTKYEKAAERNLETFMAMTVPDFGGGDEDDDEEHVEDGDEEADSVASGGSSSTARGESELASVAKEEEPSPPPKKKRSKKKPASSDVEEDVPKKKTKASTSKSKSKKASATAYKSAETINDLDDSSNEVARSSDSAPKSKKAAGKRKAKSSTDEKEGTKKKRKSDGGKAPKRKEGDAPLGTDEEEARIKKLKGLLKAAGVERPFTAATGAERTLSIADRLSHLEGKLDELGLKTGKGVKGSLPSMKSAQEVGHARAMEKEMQDLRGTRIVSGLRDGKKVKKGDDSDSDESEGKPAPKKNMFAFLKAIQSDSDSD